MVHAEATKLPTVRHASLIAISSALALLVSCGKQPTTLAPTATQPAAVQSAESISRTPPERVHAATDDDELGFERDGHVDPAADQPSVDDVELTETAVEHPVDIDLEGSFDTESEGVREEEFDRPTTSEGNTELEPDLDPQTDDEPDEQLNENITGETPQTDTTFPLTEYDSNQIVTSGSIPDDSVAGAFNPPEVDVSQDALEEATTATTWTSLIGDDTYQAAPEDELVESSGLTSAESQPPTADHATDFNDSVTDDESAAVTAQTNNTVTDGNVVEAEEAIVVEAESSDEATQEASTFQWPVSNKETGDNDNDIDTTKTPASDSVTNGSVTNGSAMNDGAADDKNTNKIHSDSDSKDGTGNVPLDQQPTIVSTDEPNDSFWLELINPNTTGHPVVFVMDDTQYELEPGEKLRWPIPHDHVPLVEFDRGRSHGSVTYLLDARTAKQFRFEITEWGWDLRLVAQVEE